MDATPEQTAEGAALVQVLAAVLDRLVGANATLALSDPGQVTKFHALKAPGIGIMQYLERIHKYGSCSNECFVLALIYIDRLIQRNNFLLTDLNIHRVVITAILLAAKFFDDAYYNNAYYAKVGGVLVSEMNGLEVDFLFRINFSLHVAPDLFHKYREQLVSHSNGPISQASYESPSMPIALVNRQSTSISHGTASLHHNTQLAKNETTNPHYSVSQMQANYTHGNEKQYITPSPPESSAMAERMHAYGNDLMASVSSGGLTAAFQGSSEAGHASSSVTHSYMQPVASMAPGATYSSPQHWRCSPHGKFNAGTTGHHVVHSQTRGEQFVVYDNVGYPYGTTLVHHNHAVNEDMSNARFPHIVYSHKQHHVDPVYVITGTSGS